MTSANIIGITHASFSDGPGMRTVVYFQGCSLACKWCHNPESISPTPQIFYCEDKCMHCGRCASVCPDKKHRFEDRKHVLFLGPCSLCAQCALVCPTGAVSLTSQRMELSQVLDEILRDKEYYPPTGGVTLSGGECLLQEEFTVKLLRLCRQNGVRTAVESALNVNRRTITRVMPLVDTFLLDMKHYHNEKHRLLTGCGNETILNNIRAICEMHPEVWIRIPVIPDENDDDDNLIQSARVIATLGQNVRKLELLRYNNLSKSKYAGLDKESLFLDKIPQSDEQMQKHLEVFKASLHHHYRLAPVSTDKKPI